MEIERPFDALSQSRGKRIVIEMKDKSQISGVLKAFDKHVNLLLENAEVRVDGKMKSKIGTVFIRGGTIVSVALE
ncbi:MAG: small nuclear ribonucleoprotein [Candidatus Woesearchaeota archaeon]|nr:MAG: small nuclear ribonucleoprotein [Candidatus Woesearchaeota archaeon]